MGSSLMLDLLQEQLTSVSYSIIFDACFGKGGAEELLKRTKSGKLEITPGELDGSSMANLYVLKATPILPLLYKSPYDIYNLFLSQELKLQSACTTRQ